MHCTIYSLFGSPCISLNVCLFQLIHIKGNVSWFKLCSLLWPASGTLPLSEDGPTAVSDNNALMTILHSNLILNRSAEASDISDLHHLP